MWFEHRRHALLPRRQFARRWAKWTIAALGVIAVSLFIGAVGYRMTEGVTSWIDAVHDAALILTGMGPAFFVQTEAGKIFETVYAIFSGVVFISVSGMLLGPPAHRLLHRFHLDEEDEPGKPAASHEARARSTHARRLN